MIEVKEYLTHGTPSKEEVARSIEIANKANCVVRLKWFIQYNGWNERYISKNDDANEVFDALSHIVYDI